MPAYRLRVQTPANASSLRRPRFNTRAAAARASSSPTCFTLRTYAGSPSMRCSCTIVLPRLRRCPARQRLMFVRGRLSWRTVKGVTP